MKPLKQKISITLDYNVVESIKYFPEYRNRSLSQYINMILKEHLFEKTSTSS